MKRTRRQGEYDRLIRRHSRTVTTRRRVTLPDHVCRRLGIAPGDNLLIVARDGALVLTRRPRKEAP
jgi:AbrB family looped-hinge helix DNA binding protein